MLADQIATFFRRGDHESRIGKPMGGGSAHCGFRSDFGPGRRLDGRYSVRSLSGSIAGLLPLSADAASSLAQRSLAWYGRCCSRKRMLLPLTWGLRTCHLRPTSMRWRAASVRPPVRNRSPPNMIGDLISSAATSWLIPTFTTHIMGRRSMSPSPVAIDGSRLPRGQ